jgi:hypothetical protein
MWSLASGRIPYVSRQGLQVEKPGVIERDEQSEWVPFADDGSRFDDTLNQRSNVRSVYNGFCGLSEIVHHALYMLYAPRRALTSQDVLEVYARYLKWYDSLPRAMAMGENSTPAVFFVQ